LRSVLIFAVLPTYIPLTADCKKKKKYVFSNTLI
jgi:hypothetical protein